MLEREYDFFLNNKETLFANYHDRVIVIKDEEVIGDYDTKEEALRETVKEHELGTFLIQEISQEELDDIKKKTIIASSLEKFNKSLKKIVRYFEEFIYLEEYIDPFCCFENLEERIIKPSLILNQLEEKLKKSNLCKKRVNDFENKIARINFLWKIIREDKYNREIAYLEREHKRAFKDYNNCIEYIRNNVIESICNYKINTRSYPDCNICSVCLESKKREEIKEMKEIVSKIREESNGGGNIGIYGSSWQIWEAQRVAKNAEDLALRALRNQKTYW